jgi:hypothetical protein
MTDEIVFLEAYFGIYSDNLKSKIENPKWGGEK